MESKMCCPHHRAVSPTPPQPEMDPPTRHDLIIWRVKRDHVMGGGARPLRCLRVLVCSVADLSFKRRCHVSKSSILHFSSGKPFRIKWLQLECWLGKLQSAELCGISVTRVNQIPFEYHNWCNQRKRPLTWLVQNLGLRSPDGRKNSSCVWRQKLTICQNLAQVFVCKIRTLSFPFFLSVAVSLSLSFAFSLSIPLLFSLKHFISIPVWVVLCAYFSIHSVEQTLPFFLWTTNPADKKGKISGAVAGRIAAMQPEKLMQQQTQSRASATVSVFDRTCDVQCWVQHLCKWWFVNTWEILREKKKKIHKGCDYLISVYESPNLCKFHTCIDWICIDAGNNTWTVICTLKLWNLPGNSLCVKCTVCHGVNGNVVALQWLAKTKGVISCVLSGQNCSAHEMVGHLPIPILSEWLFLIPQESPLCPVYLTQLRIFLHRNFWGTSQWSEVCWGVFLGVGVGELWYWRWVLLPKVERASRCQLLSLNVHFSHVCVGGEVGVGRFVLFWKWTLLQDIVES